MDNKAELEKVFNLYIELFVCSFQLIFVIKKIVVQ